MAEIDVVPTSISSLKDKLDLIKYDPTMLVHGCLEAIDEMTDSKARIVDASHPAVMLLEMGCCCTANTIQESIVNLRRQYPILAETQEDLYRHMSDQDYLNRFSIPAKTTFTMAVLYDDIANKMLYDNTEKCYKAIIARDTKVVIDGVTFTLFYPIEIRKYDNGVIQITYNSSISNPVQQLQTQLIQPEVRQTATGESWIFFPVEMIQIAVSSTIYITQKLSSFKQLINYSDKFCYARVFLRNSKTNNTWLEINTTHTDQVYAADTPTAVFTVDDASHALTVEVPVVYLSSGTLVGELRVDIYTTKGSISMNMATYLQEAFEVTMQPIDRDRDVSTYTEIFSEISYYLFNKNIVTGGQNGISFEALRKRVIYNAVGEIVIPITNVQLETEGENNGFSIAKNIDVLTNRVILATQKLPEPTNKKLITPANIGIGTVAALHGDLVENENIINNGDSLTILPNTLIKNENGVLRILRSYEINAIRSMGQTSLVNHLNTENYYYTPFYYVLDATEGRFRTRAYSLNLPTASNLSFIRQNQTLQLFVVTGSYEIKKTTTGYQVLMKTSSYANYKGLQDGQVGMQMAFQPKGETRYAYINGTMIGKTEEGDRVFSFDIETNHNVDSDNLLCITNSQTLGISNYKAWVELDKIFTFIHYTTSSNKNFIADESQQVLGTFILPDGAIAITLENLKLHFGDALDQLWKRCHSYKLDVAYKRYLEDIPATYDEDVFEVNPATGANYFVENGEIVIRYQHRKGDIVLDEYGNTVLKHKAGDVMYDLNNNPIVIESNATGREFDMLIVDGRYIIADDEATIAYCKEIETVITKWVVDGVTQLQGDLLDQTNIYFYPKTTLGVIEIQIENNETDLIPAEQEFKLELYVRKNIYENLQLREKLKQDATRLIDARISEQTINMTEIKDELKVIFGESVVAFKLSGLGGSKDYEVVKVVSGWQRLCLKKMLEVQPSKLMTVVDAVNVEFNKVAD